MSNLLRPPSLGPIVGHTTHSSARLRIRGAEVGDNRNLDRYRNQSSDIRSVWFLWR